MTWSYRRISWIKKESARRFVEPTRQKHLPPTPTDSGGADDWNWDKSRLPTPSFPPRHYLKEEPNLGEMLSAIRLVRRSSSANIWETPLTLFRAVFENHCADLTLGEFRVLLLQFSHGTWLDVLDCNLPCSSIDGSVSCCPCCPFIAEIGYIPWKMWKQEKM